MNLIFYGFYLINFIEIMTLSLTINGKKNLLNNIINFINKNHDKLIFFYYFLLYIINTIS